MRKKKKEAKKKKPVEMPHLWKSTQNVDFHKLLGKVSQKTRDFPTFPQGSTRLFI